MRVLATLAMSVVCQMAVAQQQSQVMLSVAQQQEDYDKLQKALEEAHGGLYRYTPKSAMDVLFQVFRETLTAPATRRQFISTISELLAEIHDGHTRLEYDLQTMNELGAAKLFPLQLLIESERVVREGRAFVLFNDSPTDRTILPGAELISVNGTSIGDIFWELVVRTPGDGSITTGKFARIERTFPSQYWLFINPASSFTIKVKNPDGRTVTTTIDGVNTSERLKHRTDNPVNAVALKNVTVPNAQGDNITMQWTPGNVAILRIRSFGGDDFKEQLDAKFLEAKNKQVKSMILDLRNNGGGVDEYGAFLVSQFTNKSFRYFDRIELTTIDPSFTKFTPSTYDNLRQGTEPGARAPGYYKTAYSVKPSLHPGVGIQQPAKNPFTGKLIVLTNGNTFSTAADVTAILHHLRRATFVGEETGGGYEGNTSGLNAKVVLPHSGLSLKVQMYNYWNAVEPPDPMNRGRGTIPGVPVKNTITDLLSGTDRQMEKAMTLAAAD